MDQLPIFIFISDDVRELLNDNKIDLVAQLRKDGLEVSRGFAPNPATQEGSQTKDIALVILASGATFTSISWGIAKILDALGRNKKVITKEMVLVPVTDPHGNAMHNTRGEPILYWTEKIGLIEATHVQQNSENLNVSLTPTGLSFELNSGKEK